MAHRISPAWRSRECVRRCQTPERLPLGESPGVSRGSCKDRATPTRGCAETRQQNKIKDLNYLMCGWLRDDRPRTLRSFGGVGGGRGGRYEPAGGWLVLQARVGGLLDAGHPRSPLASSDQSDEEGLNGRAKIERRSVRLCVRPVVTRDRDRISARTSGRRPDVWCRDDSWDWRFGISGRTDDAAECERRMESRNPPGQGLRLHEVARTGSLYGYFGTSSALEGTL